ncbi:MAG: PAS domain-containing protein [Oscillatoriophycideae cyanobacterium NC_groundwater_1537_Pr4_S-0.65um_50_18]|nr:PAS domain-containing protein [Oscillatoriophycideae cyanobacterium NC_groundwater_1537_Pr4_S-0.65um_50_18]
MKTTEGVPTIESLKSRDDVPVIVANHKGFIVAINSAFTTVLGWREEDVIGEPLTNILPNSFRDGHNLAFSRFQSTERATVLNHPLQLKTLTKSKSEIITEHFIVAEKIGDQWFFAATLTPIF